MKFWKYALLGMVLTLSNSLNAASLHPEYMQWDWETSEFNVALEDSIEMWGVLTNTADFSLGIELNGYGYDPGTLIVTSSVNAGNPYNMQFNYAALDTLDFYDDRLMPGDSVRFLFGTLTPNENITAGSYSTGSFSLSFLTSPQHTDPQALSNITVNVNAVPLPAAVWLFGSGLIGLVGFARCKKV